MSSLHAQYMVIWWDSHVDPSDLSPVRTAYRQFDTPIDKPITPANQEHAHKPPTKRYNINQVPLSSCFDRIRSDQPQPGTSSQV